MPEVTKDEGVDIIRGQNFPKMAKDLVRDRTVINPVHFQQAIAVCYIGGLLSGGPRGIDYGYAIDLVGFHL